MRCFLRRKLARLRGCTSGNATLLVALGMPALIGGTGFAVDTAQWYMWKRELQHSVDQAAIAGAWAMVREVEEAYEARARQEYAANQDITEGFDSVDGENQLSVSLADYAGGSDNSVLVTASATRQLPFSSFLTGSAATIRATAQASFAQGATYQACLISTAEDGTGTSIGGNATVDAKCGLAALSCSTEPPAIEIDGSATVLTDSIAACGEVVADNNEEVVSENLGSGVLKDGFADLVPPDNPVDRPNADQYCKKNGSYEYERGTLYAGTYQGGIVVRCETVLSPGIYVIDGGVLDLTANYNVLGTKVMFVLKNGAQLKLGGSGNGNKLNLTPMTAADFLGTPYAAQAERLASMLIFEDRDNEPNNDHIINGNSNSLIEGTIYLPSTTVKINGTADIASQCLQITAYRIEVLGNAQLETLCPTSATNTAGSAAPRVRLVA